MLYSVTNVTFNRPTDISLRLEVGEEQLKFEENLEHIRAAEKQFHSRMPRILQLGIALFDALMSRSEVNN